VPPERKVAFPRNLFAATLLIFAFSCGGDDGPRPVETSGPANVLLVTLDTTRADRLGCYGYRQAMTPTLDRLAAAGVRFEWAYSPVPLTLPAHTSLLTGTYPIVHGLRINQAGSLGDEIETLAERFKLHGFRTGAFVSAWVLDSTFGLDHGFDHYADNLTGENA
jgi:arylsulfatase A-like enzyme